MPSKRTFEAAKPRLDSVLKGADIRQLATFKDLEHADFKNVSLGTRPSGRLHTGNLFVLATALHYLRINSQAKIHVDVMDLDFDTQRGKVFTPFVHLSSTKQFLSDLTAAIEILSKEFGVDPNSVVLKFFSSRFTDPSFRGSFLKLFTDVDACQSVRYAMQGEGNSFDAAPISLFCPSCEQSAAKLAILNARSNSFSAICNNSNCTIGEYSVPFSSPSLFNVYYKVDPIRDLFLEPQTLHIFGGDYAKPCGSKKFPSFAYVAAIMEAARIFLDIQTPIPAFFLTPLLTDESGRKISKSIGNGGGDPSKDVLQHLRDEIVKVVDILQGFLKGTFDGMEIVVKRQI